MSAGYEVILQVQAIDLKIRQLEHRHRVHPERQAVLEAQREVDELDEKLDALRQQHHQRQRELNRLADQVAGIEARKSDVGAKLYDGSVTATKDLIALQDEIKVLDGRQAAIEDDELELMEQIEALDGEIAALDQLKHQSVQASGHAQETLAQLLAEIEHEIDEARARRRETAEPASRELLARYESLVDQFDGAPLARIVDNRCDGCHIQLSAMALDELKRASDDTGFSCEECGRLLVR